MDVGPVRYAGKGDEQASMVCGRWLFSQEFLQVSWPVLSIQQNNSGSNPGVKTHGTPDPAVSLYPECPEHLSPHREWRALQTPFLPLGIHCEIRILTDRLFCFRKLISLATPPSSEQKRCELCVLFLIVAPKCSGGNQFHPKYVLPYTDGH